MRETLPSFEDFWPFYLGQHADPRTRAVHYCGTVAGSALFLALIAGGTWWLLPAALVAGYGPAWAAHAFIERNRPATFTYPLWSFAADYRMLYCAATGRLAQELARARAL
jgi:hypothetical protein